MAHKKIKINKNPRDIQIWSVTDNGGVNRVNAAYSTKLLEEQNFSLKAQSQTMFQIRNT